MALRCRNNRKFENNQKLGSFVDINFEVYDEEKTETTAHSFKASVHYYEKGEGQPIVLVHGIGQSLYCWHKNIDCLAKNGYRVIALDLPGYGYSTQPNIYYTVEENTCMLKAFLDALGIKKAHFAGFSTGALSILLLAELYPKMVEKLILISPGGPNETYPFVMRALTTKLGQCVFRLSFSETTLEKVLKDMFFDKTHVTQNMVEQYYEPFKKKRVRDTLIMCMMHFDDIFNDAFMHAVKKDVLIFSGVNDPIHSKKIAQRFEIIPGSRHIRIRNCGHFVNEEKPDRFNSEAIMFLGGSETD